MGALSLSGGKFLLRGVVLGLDRLAFYTGGRFHLLHAHLGGFQLTLVFLTGHHAVEQSVFGFGDLVLGVLDLVLQRLIRFVGFHLTALVTVLFRTLFPMLDVHLVSLAVLEAAGQRFLRRGDLLPGSHDAGFDFGQAFREPAQALANFDQAEINGLQLNQVFEMGMHPMCILAQGHAGSGWHFTRSCGFQACIFALDSWPEIYRSFQKEIEMPDVHITWLEGRTVEQKRKVAQRITEVLMEEAGAKSESTHVVFVDLPTTNFAAGGVTVADKKGNP